MATIGNSPSATTIIRVEARKSFSLGMHLSDPHGKPVDLTGCEMTIIAKPLPIDDNSDITNFLQANSQANISVPKLGYGSFNLQALTLNVDPGEYPFAIVLKTAEGYTGVIVKGILDVQQNTEFTSVGTQYTSVNPAQSLAVQLQGMNAINVFIGGQLPPGMNYIRDDVLTVIENFNPDDIAYVPNGGRSGYVLTKINGDDYQFEWRPVGNGAFALDATGALNGQTPVSLGDGSWTWAAVGIDATAVTLGYAPVANGDGTWSWAQVATATPDWLVGPGLEGEILNKPTLGTASARADSYFVASTTLVSAMTGMVFQTTIPVTGIEGYLYFVYTP